MTGYTRDPHGLRPLRGEACRLPRLPIGVPMRGRTGTAGALAMAVLLAVSSACATVLRPFPTQRVRVESDPPGAQVFIDGEKVGVTPMVTGVSRRRAEHGLRFEKEGCLPEDYSLRRSMSSWVFFTVYSAVTVGIGGLIEGRPESLVLGPAMVISIDWFSGAMFSLPRAVRVPLRADADEGGEPGGQASGECRSDTPATAGRGPRPLSVPFDAAVALPPGGRFTAYAEFRARLRAVNRGLTPPLVAPRHGPALCEGHTGSRSATAPERRRPHVTPPCRYGNASGRASASRD